jgi:hypothetical protein
LLSSPLKGARKNIALAFSKEKVFRFWGLTGQRGWARLILGRLHDLVLSPGDSKGSTLDPDTVAHEHHSFFFPDNGHGAAGFGWRNGGFSPYLSARRQQYRDGF